MAAAATARAAGPPVLKRAAAALGLTDMRRVAPVVGAGNAECRRGGSFDAAGGRPGFPGSAALAVAPA
jgi:hypothetical protein